MGTQLGVGKEVKAVFGPYIVSARKSLARSALLVNTSYGGRGYTISPTLTSEDIIFDVELDHVIVGTVMMRLDSPNGLAADMEYAYELNAMRTPGRKLAELSRFAIMPGQPTRSLMGAMFHFVYYYAYLLNSVTDLVCEVVPHHIAGQQRLLGFTQIAGPKRCERVGVDTAVLLHRTLDWD